MEKFIVVFLSGFSIDYYSLKPDTQVFVVLFMLFVFSVMISVIYDFIVSKKRGNKKC